MATFSQSNSMVGETVDIWQRLGRLVVVLFMVVLIGMAVSFRRPQQKLEELLNGKVEAERAKQDGLRAVRDSLRAKIHLLDTDLKYNESFARDRLNLMQRGETVIRFVDDDLVPASNDDGMFSLQPDG